ncbi:MAG: lactate utilization protein [Clostridia bacterium]
MKEKLIENLNRNGFVAKLFENDDDLLAEIEKNLNKTEKIGFGGSMTIAELHLQEKLIDDGFNVCNKTTSGLDCYDLLKKNIAADVYFTSANAISEDGTIINIDGTGNRIGATCYGASKVFYIIGTNKIEPNFHEALSRAKNIAAPLNAKRLNKKTPCVVTGKCENCNSPERICRGTLIVERPFTRKTTYVYVIDKKLGF